MLHVGVAAFPRSALAAMLPLGVAVMLWFVVAAVLRVWVAALLPLRVTAMLWQHMLINEVAAVLPVGVVDVLSVGVAAVLRVGGVAKELKVELASQLRFCIAVESHEKSDCVVAGLQCSGALHKSRR